MSISYIYKDITTVTSGVVLHGTNCQQTMRSGVAKAIRDKWPQVYHDYMLKPGGHDMLGYAQPVKIDDTLWIFNCFTQEYYGRDGKKYADVNAIQQALNTVFNFANICNFTIHMPKIGCGLGGLDWSNEVEPIVNILSNQYDVKVIVYEI